MGMKLLNLLAIGVPEVVIGGVFGLMIHGQLRTREEINRKFFLNLLKTIIIVLVGAYICRMLVESIIIVAILSAVSYAFSYIYIWNLNKRQSVSSGVLVITLTAGVELIVLLIINSILFNHKLLFLDNIYIRTSITRIIQIIIVFIAYKTEFNIDRHFNITNDWDSLSTSRKINVILLLSFCITSMLLIINFSEIYGKIELHNLRSYFATNIYALTIELTLFLALVITLFHRTSMYDEYKRILERDPNDLVDAIIKSSTLEQVIEYKKQVDNYLDNAKKETEVKEK